MNFSKTDQKKKAPLFVKEIILPNEEPEDIQGRVRSISRNLKKDQDEFNVKSTSKNVIIGDHEVRPIGELLILEKRPLESYFDGIKRKPKKKKNRPSVTKHLNYSDAQSPSTTCNEGWISALRGVLPEEVDRNIVEERLQSKSMQMRIKSYMRMKEHGEQKNFMQQRLAEENYLEEQENLAETWLGVLGRQKELRDMGQENFLSVARPRQTSSRYNRIDISLLSKKFWDDGEGKEPPPKKEVDAEFEKVASLPKKSPLVGLTRVFGEKLVIFDGEEVEEKLVFVDDED